MAKRNKSGTVRRRAQIENDSNAFVRSRTIRNQDLEVDKKNQALKLERQVEKKRQSRRHKVTVSLLGLLMLAVLALLALSQFIYSINGVKYSSQPVSANVMETAYLETAESYLGAHPSGRFSFLLRQESFSNYMSEKHPEILLAKVIVRPFMPAEIEVNLRQPVAVWQTAGGSEYVDENGVTFSNNTLPEPTVLIKDESSLDIEGAAVASSRFLNFIGQAIAGLDAGGAGKVESVTIPLGAIRYVEFHLENRPYPIKAQIDREVSSQVSDIVHMIEYLDEKNITPKYVDTRVEHKAYYR